MCLLARNFVPPTIELGHDLFADDRSCEQVRKEGDEEGVVDETISERFLYRYRQGRQSGEGEEADAYRKHNVQQREIDNGEGIEACDGFPNSYTLK